MPARVAEITLPRGPSQRRVYKTRAAEIMAYLVQEGGGAPAEISRVLDYGQTEVEAMLSLLQERGVAAEKEGRFYATQRYTPPKGMKPLDVIGDEHFCRKLKRTELESFAVFRHYQRVIESVIFERPCQHALKHAARNKSPAVDAAARHESQASGQISSSQPPRHTRSSISIERENTVRSYLMSHAKGATLESIGRLLKCDYEEAVEVVNVATREGWAEYRQRKIFLKDDMSGNF